MVNGIKKIGIVNGNTRKDFYSKIGDQILLPRRVLIGKVCSELKIPKTSQNIAKIKGILEPVLDTGTGKVKLKYLDLLPHSLRGEFNIAADKETIRNVFLRNDLTIKWDRDHAVKETSDLLVQLASVRNIPDALKLLKGAFNCSGFDFYSRDLEIETMHRLMSDNTLRGDAKQDEIPGDIAQLVLRSHQIRDIIANAKTGIKIREYKDKAMFYGVWHIKDRTFWLEYGMDQNVLDKFKHAFYPRLDELRKKYSATGIFSEVSKKVVDIEKKDLFTDPLDFDMATKPILNRLLLAQKENVGGLKQQFRGLRDSLLVECERSLDEAYEVAKQNIDIWSKSDPSKSKKHLDLTIKEAFLNRKIFNRVMYNFNIAMKELQHDIALDPTYGALVNESLNIALYDDNYNVIGVIAGNNYKDSIKARSPKNLFNSLEEKQGQIRLHEKTINALANILQSENNKKRIQEGEIDTKFTLALTTGMNNKKIPLKERLMMAAENIYNICKKNGMKVGTSIMLIQEKLINNVPKKVLKVEAYYNKSKKILEYELPVGEGIAGHVAETGNPFIISDVGMVFSDPEESGIIMGDSQEREYTSKSLMCLPLKVDNEVIGVINVDGPKNRANEINAMKTVATVIPDAIDLHNLATYDSLTKLYQRHVFIDDLKEHELALRNKKIKNFSVFYFDIDDFKSKNDKIGHDAGDKVLRMVGSITINMAKKYDTFYKTQCVRGYRIGGEELGMVLVNVGQEEALKIAEELRSGIEKGRLPGGGEDLSCTVSIGSITCNNLFMPTSDETLKMVDKAMYHAKANGKNSVAVHTGNEIKLIIRPK